MSYAPQIRKQPLPARKPVLIQFAKGDMTVPNPTTSAILRAGELADRTFYFRNDLAFAANRAVPKNPHTFLTNIATRSLAPFRCGHADADRDLLRQPRRARLSIPDGAEPFFEVPIAGPLPETLNFIAYKRGSIDAPSTNRLSAAGRDRAPPHRPMCPGQPAPVGDAQVVGGMRGQAHRCLGEIQAQVVDEVAQRLIHRQGGAGQRPVRQAHATQAFGDRPGGPAGTRRRACRSRRSSRSRNRGRGWRAAPPAWRRDARAAGPG